MRHMPSARAPLGVAFHFPYIAGGVYTPGNQIFSPGEPTARWSGHEGLKDVALSWPGQVPYLSVLTNQFPFGTNRPAQPFPTGAANGLDNSMFIAGFVGKSQG